MGSSLAKRAPRAPGLARKSEEELASLAEW